MWLKFKILLGYVILLLLLILTIHIFRKEQTRRNSLRQDEHELACIRRLAGETYAGLLELSTYGETVSVWEESDLGLYRAKKGSVCNTLQELKRYVNSPGQQSRIDSLCLLLERKELLLDTVMDTFGRLRKTGEIVNRKIPAIVSRIRQAGVLPVEEKKEEETPKKGFWSFIRPGRKKSAYLQQKEQLERQRQSDGKHQGTASVTSILHSLDREVTDMQETERERLLEQMDLLYSNNTDLNHRLRQIVRDFEADAGVRLDERYRQFISTRDRSFHTVSLLAVLVSSLTVLLYLIIHRDLNRISRYQRQLEASNRENTELLQSRKRMMLTIAHDLRSPLATIRGTAELLPGEQERAMQEEYAGNIRHASDYMLSLVDTLMNFYLLDTGQARENISIFRLESLFREIADNHAPLVKKKGLRMLTRFTGMDAVVCSDRGHLQQIVNNLLSNALKFTVKGYIRLEATYHEGELRVKVQDTGTGMDEGDRQRIFDAFERLDNARGIPGFGLGLAITSRLISQMGGSIRVESRPDEGSCFIVLLPLPLADSGSLKEEPPLPAGYQLEGLRVLLLDDDPRQLSLTREMFRRNRVECDCCTDCRKVVEKLRENDYDILLTDIRMPDMDGFELLGLLRSSNIERARRIPVMALTAGMDAEEEYLSGGFAGCVRKPFRMEELMEAVSRSVGRDRQTAWRPDFSLILSGEDDREGMLDVFISEGRKDLDRLHGALEKNDRPAVREILHKNLPLWTSVRLDYPAEKLRAIIVSDPELWTEERIKCIREIGEAAERLITCAENMKRNIRQENEKRHS